MNEIAFTVYGKSETKGSTRSFVSNTTGAIVTKNDNPKASGWAMRIGYEAGIAMRGRKMLFGAVELHVHFYLPQPLRLKKSVRYHTKKPDLDKLVRCAKDALTGIVWRDDSQVSAFGSSGKDYAGWVRDPLGDFGRPRAEIRIVALEERTAAA